ncbi:DUF4910 domain-containing protein [Novispirillum itersonii]|uniref:DUF4910 domain-containing protein n=1 Tax=Novispirillum itersonii TaxID=189 RepID=UPI0003AAA630|nr:DUF4910 domain-containing protein [Novispirillum itersonii]
MIGNEIYKLAEKLWPINRSLTGEGVRQTLRIIQNELPELKIFEVPSGTQVFDWVVPKEWNVSDAYIITPSGKKICDFKKNNLHLVGYSTPIRLKLSLAELQEHLHSLPNQPNAIPYITSYYKERWGFCISHEERLGLEEGVYEIYVDTQLFDGSLTYGEFLLKGDSSKEVFISTYVCHPSMANNELSGPCVTAFLAKKLKDLGRTKYSYRLIFIPETIGSITYLSKNIEHLKNSVFAGFNVSCVGDNRDYSYLPSRNGNTLSDQVSKHVLRYICPTYKVYTWGDRGSDERQYCAPGVDLPIASIMRTKYGMYDEYHTSLDDLINVVTAEGLDGGFNAIWNAIEALERNVYPKVKVLCEPQLGKRGLYPTLSTKASGAEVRLMMNLITWSDGTRSLIEIADLCGSPVWELYPIVDKLSAHNLIDLLEAPDQ